MAVIIPSLTCWACADVPPHDVALAAGRLAQQADYVALGHAIVDKGEEQGGSVFETDDRQEYDADDEEKAFHWKGPNELKLSDGHWRSQARSAKDGPAASGRSLERVVRRVELGVWGTGTDDPPAGE